MGLEHKEDRRDKGYVKMVGSGAAIIGDVNETGRAVIADLLREQGYEPLVP